MQDVTNLGQGEFYGKLVESDYSTFKARIKGNKWPVKEWDAFADVTPELITANYRRIQQEVRSLLAVNPISPFQPIQAAPAPLVPKPTPPAPKLLPNEPKSKSNGQADDF